MIDTAVIIPVYGDHCLLLEKVLQYHYKQDLAVQFIVVELLDGDSKLSEDVSCRTTHIGVMADDGNGDLCQKEAMLNIGFQYIGDDVDYVIFLDCDVFSFDVTWFGQIRGRIVNDNNIVQCFSFLVDTVDMRQSFVSFSYMYVNHLINVAHNPGIGWGMTVNKFKSIGGFNPWFVEYSGDSAFVQEVFGVIQFHQLDNLNSLIRIMDSNNVMSYVDVRVVHLNHGWYSERSYDARKFLVNSWFRNIIDVVSMGDNGLLRWLDDSCVERLLLQRLKFIDNDFDKARELLNEFGLGGQKVSL